MHHISHPKTFHHTLIPSICDRLLKKLYSAQLSLCGLTAQPSICTWESIIIKKIALTHLFIDRMDSDNYCTISKDPPLYKLPHFLPPQHKAHTQVKLACPLYSTPHES